MRAIINLYGYVGFWLWQSFIVRVTMNSERAHFSNERGEEAPWKWEKLGNLIKKKKKHHRVINLNDASTNTISFQDIRGWTKKLLAEN